MFCLFVDFWVYLFLPICQMAVSVNVKLTTKYNDFGPSPNWIKPLPYLLTITFKWSCFLMILAWWWMSCLLALLLHRLERVYCWTLLSSKYFASSILSRGLIQQWETEWVMIMNHERCDVAVLLILFLFVRCEMSAVE